MRHNIIDQEKPNRKLYNIEIAEQAIIHCRKIIPIEGSGSQPLIKNKTNTHKIFQNIKKARRSQLNFTDSLYCILMNCSDFYPKYLKRIKKIAKTHKVGNCDELSDLAMNFLRKNNINCAEKISILNGDHVIVVMDRNLDSDINDIANWGESCVILDILNNEIYDPSQIYKKLKCYKFSINRDNPHIITDFTHNDKLIFEDSLIRHVNAAENADKIKSFHDKLTIFKNSFAHCLDLNTIEAKKLNDMIDSFNIDIDQYNLDVLTNFEIEIILDKKIKMLIKGINDEYKNQERDKIFNDVLINLIIFYPSIPEYFSYIILFDLFPRLINFINTDDTNNPLIAHLTDQLIEPDMLDQLLSLAMDYNKPSTAQILLEMKACPVTQNSNGLTPLLWAAKWDYKEIIDLLLDPTKGFIQQINIDYRTQEGWAALYLAAANGNLHIVEELLKHGADPYLKEQEGYMPIHIAAQTGHLDIVKLLLANFKSGVINNKTSSGSTPLHLAIQEGYYSVVEELLSKGGHPYLEDNNGFMAIHLAARYGQLNIIKLLLDHDGFTINLSKKDGWSALHLAVANGHLQIVEELLQRGADPESTTHNGETPLILANQTANADMIKCIHSALQNKNEHAEQSQNKI